MKRNSKNSSAKVSSLGQLEAEIVEQIAAEHRVEYTLFERQFIDRSKRATSGAMYRNRLLKNLANKTGFDLGELEKQHAADYATCKKQATEQRKIANTLVRERLANQKALLQHILKHRERFEYKVGNPVLRTCVWSASRLPFASIFSNPESSDICVIVNDSGRCVTIAPQVQSLNPAAGANRFTFNAACHVASAFPGPVHFAYLDIVTTAVFRVPVSQEGILSVRAFFTPVGSYTLDARGGCFATGQANIELLGRVRVHVVNPEGEVFRTPRPPWEPILSEEVNADCESDTRSGLFNFDTEAFSTERSQVMRVLEGDNVVVTAQYRFLVFTRYWASAEVDLSSPDFGLNVPLVLTTIES